MKKNVTERIVYKKEYISKWLCMIVYKKRLLWKRFLHNIELSEKWLCMRNSFDKKIFLKLLQKKDYVTKELYMKYQSLKNDCENDICRTMKLE